MKIRFVHFSIDSLVSKYFCRITGSFNPVENEIEITLILLKNLKIHERKKKTSLVPISCSKSLMSCSMLLFSKVNTMYNVSNKNAADAKKNASDNSLKFDASKMKKTNGGTKKNNKALNVMQFLRKCIDRRPEASIFGPIVE